MILYKEVKKLVRVFNKFTYEEQNDLLKYLVEEEFDMKLTDKVILNSDLKGDIK